MIKSQTATASKKIVVYSNQGENVLNLLIAEKRSGVDCPVHSEYLDTSDVRWKGTAGAIVALYCVLKHQNADALPDSIDEFIETAAHRFAHKVGLEWTLTELVQIADFYSVEAEIYGNNRLGSQPTQAKKQELSSFFFRRLTDGPCLVVIHPDFMPNNPGIKTIVATHLSKNSIRYIDTSARTTGNQQKGITTQGFLVGWRWQFIAFQR